ncbi:mother-specific HO expression [Pestalotiopsis sp. IQ-011]
MPSRLQKPRRPSRGREAGTAPNYQDNLQNEPISPAYLLAADASATSTPTTPTKAASPFNSPTQSTGGQALNMANVEARYNPFTNSPKSLKGGNKQQHPSTIRTVPSFEDPSDTSSSDPHSARNSGFSSSLNSNASGASIYSQNQTQFQTQNGTTSRFSKAPTSYPSKPQPGATTRNSANPMASSDATLRPADNGVDAEEQAPDGSAQWDGGAVGKAALGKTGRVINKLVSDNEALRRDLKIERIKSEEAKQAAKLMEDKMERMVSEYESRLLEANVTKTLLARKERQVETLQQAVELEKKRTADAQDRERTWKDELEKGRRDANVQVDEAKTHAAMMEGRYNAIASHWKDQGNEVKKATTTLRSEIAALVEERKRDDDKINTLRDLCDQQDGNIKDLRKQNEAIGNQFETYKNTQEDALKSIKENARNREEEQLRTIEETKQALGQLKWALQVKANVRGAG